jgi:SAM-dependent methyltransferase
MEISKDDAIFKIIDNISLNTDENIENIIKVEVSNPVEKRDTPEVCFTGSKVQILKPVWTEDNYYNFVNIMTSEGYIKEEEPQTLHVYSNEYLLTIKSAKRILHYCNNNAYKYNEEYISWYKYSEVIKSNDSLFNSNLIFLKIKKSKIETDKEPVINWDKIQKYFKINKCITYTDSKTNVKYIVNISKSPDRDYYEAKEEDYHIALNKSKIINKTQQYEFYIDITNTDKDNIIPSIIKMEQALHLNSFIISRSQQLAVIMDYGKLVKNDIFTRRFNNKKPPLLTPKPFTLERNNLLNPSDYDNGYGITTILSEYTVTEKADGERLLMYIDGVGGVYLINNTHQVIDTGLKSPSELYDSLIDGEYITCNKRQDNASVGLYASFDMYYHNNKKLTHLPLIADSDSGQSRYNYLLKTEKLLASKKNDHAIVYIVKEHMYSKDILEDCKKILTNTTYQYEIDGLIFTPAKLAVLSNYANKPERISDNFGWPKVLKWKPPEQNSIDFLVKKGEIITIDTVKYTEFKLYIGYNKMQVQYYTMEEAFNYIYKFKMFKDEIEKREMYTCMLFKPEYYYETGIDKSLIKLLPNKEIRCENGDKIEDEIIVEFNYDITETNPSLRWKPMRVREDKTRIYRQGILSKTLNDYKTASNIWRSIHNPISQSNIMGNERIINNMDIAELSSNDDYYSRTLRNEARLSHYLYVFHNHGIKDMLYSKPTKKRSIVELACGQGGDFSRWIKNEFGFVLGVDLVKNNIYNPRDGAYARLLKERKTHDGRKRTDNCTFVFAIGDCSKPIKTGECAISDDQSINDKDSYNVLKMVFSGKNKKYGTQFNNIIGKGKDGFDVCSCMFAIHYFFKSEEALDGYLLNVNQLLKNGGEFICTFMDGEKIESEIENNGGDKIEGFKNLSKIKEDRGEPVWAILRCYDKNEVSPYNKQINVFIETTGKLIPEYVVSYKFLIEKCKDYGIRIKESEMFSDTFNRFKNKLEEIKETNDYLHKSIIELDKEENKDLKRFSSFNRWCIFEKVT